MRAVLVGARVCMRACMQVCFMSAQMLPDKDGQAHPSDGRAARQLQRLPDLEGPHRKKVSGSERSEINATCAATREHRRPSFTRRLQGVCHCMAWPYTPEAAQAAQPKPRIQTGLRRRTFPCFLAP
jgi:hypothetical protein